MSDMKKAAPPATPRGTIPRRLRNLMEDPGEWYEITTMGPKTDPWGYYKHWRTSPSYAEFDLDRFEFSTQLDEATGRKVMYGRYVG